MALHKLLFLIWLCSLLGVSQAQRESTSSVICMSQTSCDKCLEAAPSCAWCTSRTLNMSFIRCMTASQLQSMGCGPEYILENKPLEQNILQNEALSDFSATNPNAFQIRPQRVKLNLRKSRMQVVKMKFRPARNYPLDLYYLMDLTWTMRDDKETLVRMGGSLAKALNNLTENSRLGFGSFADKPAMPYIMTTKVELQNPCAVEQAVCEPTYLYRHQLSLTSNVGEFVKQVNMSKVTGNVDNFEGGLEALMQVLVCESQIGWKDKSRKIVVFATDGLMHVAGTGLLGGVVARNDKRCHLNPAGDYTAALRQDYPSLEEIYRELARRKVNVIFAVTADIIAQYEAMQDLMEDLTRVGLLQTDSSNVLQLVEEGFREFSKHISFQDDSPEYVRVEYFTTCGGKYPEPVESASCDNVEIGKEYEFELRVHLLKNPEGDVDEKLNIRVEEASLNEHMMLEFSLEDSCSCFKEEKVEEGSSICSGNGNFSCGTCFCDDGFVGKTCDCNVKNFSSDWDMEKSCQSPRDSVDNTVCSGRGDCLCGTCYCYENFHGDFCECDNCKRTNGKECNDHGKCECGNCKCEDGWHGSNCECPPPKSICASPDDPKGKICSNHGECSCDKCVCKEGYFGPFCESSQGQNNTLCVFYEPCVEAKIRQRGGDKVSNYPELCFKEGQEYSHEFVDELPKLNYECIARVKIDDAVCDFKFNYIVEAELRTKFNIEDQVCPPPNYATVSMILVALFTALIGLLLLFAWRTVVFLNDKREYAQFEQRLANSEFAEMNPIYKTPITQHRNPQFVSKSKENMASL